MDSLDKVKELLQSLPDLLNRYSGYSYVLQALLLAAGLVLGVVHWRGKKNGGPGLPVAAEVTAGLLVFLSLGGAVLRWSGAHAQRHEQAAAAARKRELTQRF